MDEFFSFSSIFCKFNFVFRVWIVSFFFSRFSKCFIFSLLYLLDPPILVVISILLLIFGLIYISGPLYVDSLELNYHDEKYSQIYQRIAYFEEFIRKQCQSIRQPSTTVDIVIGCALVCLAFCGQWIDVFVWIYFRNKNLLYLSMLLT